MPVIRRSDFDYEADRWHDWLMRHSLTRADGKWLADRRDPTPLKRRKWTTNRGRENWLWAITANDFLDALAQQSSLPRSLCVRGSWTDFDQDLIETIHIVSALVNPDTSDSLANALRTCEEPHYFGLPHYPSQDSHFNKPPFVLTGWIQRRERSSGGLDYFDPYAREIGYPPDEVGESFLATLGLSPDPEQREWRLPNAEHPSVNCEIWSEKSIVERDEPFRSGERMSAAVDLLKLLCSRTGKDLIFQVKIERRQDRRHRSGSEDDLGYVPASHKIFILSSNGILRDTAKSYRIG
jgi:hypothetical protein